MTGSKISTTPEIILPDNASFINRKGLNIRKGSIAAFIKNIEVLEDINCSKKDRVTALEILKELAPAVVLIGLYKQVNFKNKRIQKILDETAYSLLES